MLIHGMSALLCITLPACDGGGTGQGQSIAKAVAKPEPEAAKPAAKPKAKPPEDPNASPWAADAVETAMAQGTKVAYARTGTDAKGKKVGGTLTYVLERADDDGATTSFTIAPDPGSNKASAMPATAPHSTLSPLFAMEKPTIAMAGRESITVPAGTFDAAKAELTDFFGNGKTVWMIVDRPGLYAKVHDRGNGGDEADKTDITYELVALPGG